MCVCETASERENVCQGKNSTELFQKLTQKEGTEVCVCVCVHFCPTPLSLLTIMGTNR